MTTIGGPRGLASPIRNDGCERSDASQEAPATPAPTTALLYSASPVHAVGAMLFNWEFGPSPAYCVRAALTHLYISVHGVRRCVALAARFGHAMSGNRQGWPWRLTHVNAQPSLLCRLAHPLLSRRLSSTLPPPPASSYLDIHHTYSSAIVSFNMFWFRKNGLSSRLTSCACHSRAIGAVRKDATATETHVPCNTSTLPHTTLIRALY